MGARPGRLAGLAAGAALAVACGGPRPLVGEPGGPCRGLGRGVARGGWELTFVAGGRLYAVPAGRGEPRCLVASAAGAPA